MNFSNFNKMSIFVSKKSCIKLNSGIYYNLMNVKIIQGVIT